MTKLLLCFLIAFVGVTIANLYVPGVPKSTSWKLWKKKFNCTSEGYFPDPKKCNKYHYCPRVRGDAKTFKCPDKYVFNANGINCKRLMQSSDCSPIKCNGHVNTHLLYQPNPAYYALCSYNGKKSKPLMYKCPDVENNKFNIYKRECEFVCKSEGKHASPHCDRYYLCNRVGFEMNYSTQFCASGTYFDPITNNCVWGKCPR